MNNINNLISEELGKMSQLFHYQRGKVISEQATDINTDVGQMMRQLDATNTNEDAVLNIIKRYKDNQGFQNFVNQYKKITNKDFGTHLITAISPSTDRKEWNDLSAYLKKLGITLEYGTTDKGNTSIAIFKGLGSAPKAEVKTDEATIIKNITSAWCREKDGIINWPGAKIDQMKWDDYYNKYVKTEARLTQVKTAAQTACPNKSVTTVVNDKVSDTSKVNTNKQKRQVIKQQVASINQEIQKSIGSTNPTGSLSDAEIQQLITKFGGTV